MKKRLLSAVLSAAFLFGAVPSAIASHHQYQKPDMTWQMHTGQIFRSIGEPGTVYEVLTPDKAHLISDENGTAEFCMDQNGDVYIMAYLPDGRQRLCHLIVGDEHRTVIEHKVEHRTPESDTAVASEAASEDPSQFAEQVLRLVNHERQQRGLAPLRLSYELMDAAAIRANEITQVFSHTRPNGQPCSSLIEDGAYTVGENIAAGTSTPEAVVNQWMQSPGHRANILNGDYEELGVGYAYRPNSTYRWYWVQMFRRPMYKAYQYY